MSVPVIITDAINSDVDSTVEVVDRKLRTVAMSYLDAIRHGLIPDHDYLNIRGHNHAIDDEDAEISALGTGVWGNWPSAAAGAVLVSGHAQDNASGTGAKSVIVRGLDVNFAPLTATIIPTGLTPTAATSEEFFRINEVEVVTSGTGRSNAGDITVSISGADIIMIYAKHNTSDAGRYTVPAGKQMSLENPEGSAVGNKDLTYHIFCADATVANSPFLLRGNWHSKDGGYRPNGKLKPFSEKTDMIFIGHAAVAGAACSASVEGWIEPTPTP